jgi:2-oxoglutarate ferredoxin oxidoreductase subunit beta
VHDNQIYGLTKGQASPTTEPGYKTKIQSRGVVTNPFRPLELAITLGAGFVARGSSKEQDHLSKLIVAGVKHRGFSLIDVLQPCVTYNKLNTYDWYAERVYQVDSDSGYDVRDRSVALLKAAEWGERIPIGILYHSEVECYEDRIGLSEDHALVDADIGDVDIAKAIEEFA